MPWVNLNYSLKRFIFKNIVPTDMYHHSNQENERWGTNKRNEKNKKKWEKNKSITKEPDVLYKNRDIKKQWYEEETINLTI